MNILIGDAEPRVRFGLRLLFEQQPGWNVAAEVDDAHALLEAVRLRCPDLVVLDWELPGMPAEELLAQIRQQCTCLRVVFMSGKIELRSIALLAGADIFAYKADPPEKLLEQIRGFSIRRIINPGIDQSGDLSIGIHQSGDLSIGDSSLKNINPNIIMDKDHSPTPDGMEGLKRIQRTLRQT